MGLGDPEDPGKQCVESNERVNIQACFFLFFNLLSDPHNNPIRKEWGSHLA